MTPTAQNYHDGDIQRLHQRIDSLDSEISDKLTDLAGDHSDLSISVGKIETRLELAPKPSPRPCQELATHLAEHKEARSLWQRPFVTALVHLAELGFIALLTWAFVADKRPPGLPAVQGRAISKPAATGGP